MGKNISEGKPVPWEVPLMARAPKEKLRPLPPEERTVLKQTARAHSERAERVPRAKALLAVADGATFVAAAQAAGRRSNDGVAHLVARFNRHGLAAVAGGHGGGPKGALWGGREKGGFRGVCPGAGPGQGGAAGPA